MPRKKSPQKPSPQKPSPQKPASQAEKPLRFAALIRVSTEKQRDRGESLRTQRRQIEDAGAVKGGRIVCWYGGQEHATAGWEHAEVERLLADAEKRPKPFDAVIVAEMSRWSRDVEASARTLSSPLKLSISRTQPRSAPAFGRGSRGASVEVPEPVQIAYEAVGASKRLSGQAGERTKRPPAARWRPAGPAEFPFRTDRA